jgi:glycosyltransferase involved in cell wall biosynthesis
MQPLYKNEVKISVLMPCYNAASYISDAINSVLSQTVQQITRWKLSDHLKMKGYV